ncbi:digeranylgeranylglycerophospholipid reductase [Natranaeroarchaeum sulfidigenes]|uniref:Dehydrogenase (Flavoprotein) n=1 Tax=Natranaeroarchaeum sulfidigenes TaxID=2784880 RepID=A0A897MLE1_9EURY|nr:digeranylgeranylglycerophospholipid reductase [Natranaeroarchaeum sulfidigenes]QSG03000.1 Dehydrogenase (flavoprotein) [Natranaeroarchaeum sulfidigenes]
MNDEYDIVIAGAGPAGGQCARDLAARDYDVLVLETEPESEFPRQSNKSTAGTFPSMMSAFGVPGDVVQQYTDSVVLESPNDHFTRDLSGAVLDFAAFKRWLVAEARENGAEFRFDARVAGPVMEGDEIVGVRFNGDREVNAEIVIDATGPSAPLASELGVSTLERENQAIGIDYHMEGIDLDHEGYGDLHDAMMLRLDHDIAPGGYSWIFHTGEDTAKVGVCYIQNERHREKAKSGMTIDGYMQHWLDTDPRFENASKIEGGEVLRGSAHIQMPGRMHTDSFMAIGDTVPTIDPLWGEGINKCMQSGRAAAIAVDHALTPAQPDTSADRLSVYEDLWHEQVAPKMKSRLLMTEILYLAPNDRYDRLMTDLNRLDDETLSRANDGDKAAIRKLLHLSDIPELLSWAKRRLRDPSNRWNPA